MATAPTTGARMTAEELLSLGGDRRHELVDGVLHEMTPAGGDHGEVALAAATMLMEYRRAHGGRAYAAETGFVLARDPDTVRAPDAAYLGPERARTVGSTSSYIPGPPDLAVEVLSPGDTYSEVHEQALAWIAVGSGVVLVVDPRARRVTRYRKGEVVAFAGDQPVDCSPAMPGFSPTGSQLLGDPL